MFLSRRDLKRLLAGTRLQAHTFVSRYCREVNISGIRRISLIEQANNDCIFWQKDGCSVYRHRPMQCRSYPFWSGNLTSARSWERLSASCPGIGKGRLHSGREIERWLNRAADHRLDNRLLSTFDEIE